MGHLRSSPKAEELSRGERVVRSEEGPSSPHSRRSVLVASESTWGCCVRPSRRTTFPDGIPRGSRVPTRWGTMDGFRGRDTQLSLRVWLLGGWLALWMPHIQGHMGSINWGWWVTKEKKKIENWARVERRCWIWEELGEEVRVNTIKTQCLKFSNDP